MQDTDKKALPADQLNEAIGVLARRETEARLMAPLIEALARAFGREEVLAVIRDTVIKIAHSQGQHWPINMAPARTDFCNLWLPGDRIMHWK